MSVTIQSFWLPKAGNTTAEYEDAFWPTAERDSVPLPVRLAVGDGATETSFSDHWAKLLVEDYGKGLLTTRETLRERLPLLQNRWMDYVRKKPLPWYAEEKLRAGAFSSLVGLTIETSVLGAQDHAGRWNALAIGDSCVFQVRGEKLLCAFPLGRTDQFDNRPVLLPSVSAGEEGLLEAIREEEGFWQAGDDFYLMSDALACWFLRLRELPNGAPWSFMKELRAGPDFDKLVEEQRTDEWGCGQRMLKNDDVTVLRCRIEVPE
jgi:hypothetical protein